MSQPPPPFDPRYPQPPYSQPPYSQPPYAQPPYAQPPYMPPPGYSPQYGYLPYYTMPPADLLAPARRAGLLLLVLGVGALLLSGCGAASFASMTDADFGRALASQPNNPELARFTPATMRSVAKAMFIAVGGCGVVGILLGIFVRGGSRAAAIVAIVALSLPILGLAAMLLGSLGGGAATAGMALIIAGVPLALLVTVVVLLVGALGAAKQFEQGRLQQQMMMQHQQANYSAQGYGQPPDESGPPAR